ncbi:MAG TPA: hypothetical protein VF657_26275 [Actinoplanes sp.]
MPNARPPLAAAPPHQAGPLDQAGRLHQAGPRRHTALLRAGALLGVSALLAAGCGSPGTVAAAPSGPPSGAASGSAVPSGTGGSPVPVGVAASANATPAPTPTRTGTTATATATAADADATLPGTAHGVFMPYRAGATAVTYDPAVVPAGASATVTRASARGGTTVRLTVTGMVPRRAYGAHLHTEPCGRTPEQAGPHYQNEPDPKAVASPPSVDPRFANPRNEVWLDFTADATGSATARTSLTWPFDSVNPPRSLVLHAERTRTAAGRAGNAGPRAACLTLPL